MKLDGTAIEAGTTLEADVCIIGGGAAGIALALELLSLKLTVCLLESGGYEADSRTQALYKAKVESRTRYGNLAHTRLRFFGGTTNHWTGWCPHLDPVYLRDRRWVPASGWPIAWSELARWYPRADELAELPSEEATAWIQKDGLGRLNFNPSLLAITPFRFSPPTRFGTRYRRQLQEATGSKLVLNANVTKIQRAVDKDTILHVVARSLDGPEFRARARAYVLATGAVENARLLLASRDVETAGLGNRHDAVGRYYMDNVRGRAGYWMLSDPALVRQLHLSGRAGGGQLLRVADRAQEQGEIVGVELRPVTFWRRPTSKRQPLPLESSVAGLVGPEAARNLIAIQIIAECPPSRDNHVSLVAERDELGVPRAKLRWQIPRQIYTSAAHAMDLLGREVGRLGLGRVFAQAAGELELDCQGTHHMGTTRMATDPRAGVVDADCRVHGLDNLYVAGSSIFPTCGTSNPTITIVALALRLAHHIHRTLG